MDSSKVLRLYNGSKIRHSEAQTSETVTFNWSSDVCHNKWNILHWNGTSTTANWFPCPTSAIDHTWRRSTFSSTKPFSKPRLWRFPRKCFILLVIGHLQPVAKNRMHWYSGDNERGLLTPHCGRSGYIMWHLCNRDIVNSMYVSMPKRNLRKEIVDLQIYRLHPPLSPSLSEAEPMPIGAKPRQNIGHNIHRA